MSAYVEAMFSVEEMPWHKLGVVLDNPPSIEEGIKLAGLDWSVEMVDINYSYPLYTDKPGRYDDSRQVGTINGHKAICRLSEDGRKVVEVFGVVTDKYTPLQNSEAFEFFQPVLDSGLVTLETAGSLKHGEVVWVMAKLTEDVEVGRTIDGKRDIVKRYLLLHTAHNGKRSVKISFTPIRVVCWNTLSMANEDLGVLISHRKNVVQKVEEISYDFHETLEIYNQVGKVYQHMAAEKPSDEYVETFCDHIFQTAQLDPIAVIGAKKKKKTVILNYDHEVQSYWGLLNAFTGFIDHDSITRGGDEGRLNNIWFGNGAKMKSLAYKYLSDFKSYN